MELEVRYTHLENLVEQLSELIREQAGQIGTLERKLADLEQMAKDAGAESDIDPGHYPPPHY